MERVSGMDAVLVVVPHQALRTALAHWMAAAMPCARVLTAADLEGALALCRPTPPDLILFDFGRGGEDSARALRRLRELCDKTPIIAMVDFSPPPYAADARRSGATWVVCQETLSADLEDALSRLSVEGDV